MKKTLLLFLFLLPFLGIAQTSTGPLNGDYIISTANTDVNFRSLALAVNAANTRGVSGPVRFLLDENQTMTSQIVISQITGSSTVNTLTIKPNATRNITVSANMPNGYTGIPAIFLFNGTSNIIIDGSNSSASTKNLTLVNNDNLNYTERSIIWVASNGTTGSSNVTLKNTILRFSTRNQGVTLLSGVYSGSNDIGGNNSISVQVNTAVNSNINIVNNEMINTKEGIYINGNNNSSRSPLGWKIQGNKIGSTLDAEKPIRGMYISNALNYEISANTISGIRNTENQSNDTGAILLLGTSSGTISNNFISDITNTVYNNGYLTAGILVKSTSNNNIYNNIISNIFNTTADSNNGNFQNKGHNIYVASGNGTNIYFNTIIASGAPTGTAYASCLYLTGGSGINVRNNIFVNSQSNRQYGVFNNGGTLGTVSNNNYYVTNSTNSFSNRIGGTEYIGTGASGFSAWNSAVSDSNSIILAPTFVSATDFHLQNVSANNTLTGTTISGITTDIDGDTRVKPYMGADELVVCTPSGDQTTSGINSWIGYVYSWTGTAYPNPATPTTLPVSATSTYIGTVTENALFDRNVTSGQVNGVTRNIPCDTPPSDKFFVRYKMQTTTAAGRYNFTIGGDDGVRLYVDGSLVTVAPTGSYGVHSYNTYAAQVDLTAGTHNFILEYFENDGDSRVSFSYGQIQGNVALPFGDNKWNVYGFTVANINLPSYAYAGMYVDNNVNVNTQTSWGRTSSPSAASSWLGAPVGVDQFTITYKRQGFPCGRYQIQLVNCDDVGEIYVDGTKVFTQNGYTGTSAIINGGTTYLLNKNSTVEIRLREDGGDANIAVNFIDTPTVYNGSGTLASDTSIRISANTTLGSDLQVCSCTVDTGVTFTIPANRTLTVDETINVAGTGKLLIQNNGSLLQKNTTAAAYTGAVTSFEMQRNTAPVRRYDFSYWSSPVTLASNFTLYKLSPNTLGDKYYSYNPNSGWAINYNGTQVMTPGQGYIVRAPQSFDINSTAVYTASFIGVPNNGDVTITPVGGQWNLIGNPYPSALDAQKLMTANNNVGSLYFWTHNSPPSNTVSGDATYNYTSNDYAVYNFSGGVATSSGAAAPSGYIAAGQSFFINASSSNNIVFTNDMRVGGNNTQFFKTAKAAEEVERNRLWLNFKNTQGAFKQALVGYIEGATNSLDNGFDAETMAGNSYVDFYSINDALQLTIQGRALPFENSDIIPLGYNTSIAGDFTISIDHVDGMFNDQAVYLEDKKTSTIYDLKAGDYTFKTEAGTFDDRFTLRYTNKTLGTGDFENVDNGLLVSVKDKVIKVTSNKENIKSTAIYDISGRLIYDKNKVGTTELQISNLQSADQVLLVKIILENNYTLTKKIIFK